VVIFTLEALVKIVAMGFLIGEDCYLRHYWNMLDFIVVVAGLIDLISSSAGAALSPLRLIRTLQPLRALNKFRSGRLVLETLGASSAAPDGRRAVHVMVRGRDDRHGRHVLRRHDEFSRVLPAQRIRVGFRQRRRAQRGRLFKNGEGVRFSARGVLPESVRLFALSVVRERDGRSRKARRRGEQI
jgi:hypothetical protein